VSWVRSSNLWLHALSVAVLTAVCLILAGIFLPAGHHDRSFTYVVIEPGLTFSQIAGRVSDAGLVKDKVPFLVLGRIFRIEHRAKAGRYRFRSGADMVEILRALYRGATYRERVLIPPGWTIPQVARELRARAEVDSVGFVTLARDSAFVTRLGVPSVSAEGFLFPDTYDVEWHETPETSIRRMVGRFFRVFDDSLRMRAANVGMTLTQAVTLASIIEKEAMHDSERPRISAVFHNRLARGMRLQADPTVRYALHKFSGRLLYRDLKVDSPFNTYVAAGLPPHPICSPGLASLVAALYPSPDSRDLYFVAKGGGSHHFSATVAEHNRAKARYRTYLDSLSTHAGETRDGPQVPD
jgi:UPF0755 protein